MDMSLFDIVFRMISIFAVCLVISGIAAIAYTLRTYANSSNDSNGGVYKLLAEIGIWGQIGLIALGLLVGAIVILLLGKNPLEAYGNLLQGSGLLMKEKYAGGKSILTDFLSFVDYWTPMIFAALAVAVALKAGLFNIGVSGQMLAAGFVASIAVGYSALAAPIAKPLVNVNTTSMLI